MKTLLLLGLIACGKSEPPDKLKPVPSQPEPAKPEPAKSETKPTTTAPKPDAKPAQPGLTVVMDGTPIAVRTVHAARYSDDQITIELKNYDETCDSLTTGSTTRSSTQTDLDFTMRLTRFLHADGTLAWAVHGVYWHPKREQGSYTKQTEYESGGKPLPKELVLDAAAGTSFELPVAVELEMDDDDLKKKRTLTIKGTAKATGCGDAKLKRDLVLPPPQDGAWITVANKKLPIRGAALAVKKTGERELTVATGEVICVEGTDYASAKWPDVEIKLSWGPDGKAWSAARSGRWVPQAGNAKFGTLSVTPNRPPGGAKEMTINLAGATTIGDYPVALEGKIKAAVCQAPK